MNKQILFAIIGSSGSGKTTLIKGIIDKLGRDVVSSFPTCTTRNIRPGENDGKDYFFLNKKDFNLYIKTHDIIEAKKIYGNIYGTNIRPILDMADYTKSLIKDFDVDGYKNVIKKIYDNLEQRNLPLFPIVTILVDADDKTLASRMKGRNDNTNVTLREQELIKDRVSKNHNHYDYIIDTTNLDIPTAIKVLGDIMNQEYIKHCGEPLFVENSENKQDTDKKTAECCQILQ